MMDQENPLAIGRKNKASAGDMAGSVLMARERSRACRASKRRVSSRLLDRAPSSGSVKSLKERGNGLNIDHSGVEPNSVWIPSPGRLLHAGRHRTSDILRSLWIRKPENRNSDGHWFP